MLLVLWELKDPEIGAINIRLANHSKIESIFYVHQEETQCLKTIQNVFQIARFFECAPIARCLLHCEWRALKKACAQNGMRSKSVRF